MAMLGKATYARVKEYIRNEFGLKGPSLFIVQVKKRCGIEIGKKHNFTKSEDARQPQVTTEAAIMMAFRHFKVILNAFFGEGGCRRRGRIL